MNDTPELAELKNIIDNWEAMAKADPKWSILTEADKKGNKWDDAEFFNTGIVHVGRLKEMFLNNKLFFVGQNALDFGCGIGRITYALTDYFIRCVGIDASSTMVKEANKRRSYYKQTIPKGSIYFTSLYIFNRIPYANGIFDFVHSWIVLQHMPEKYSWLYIKEFVRVTRPGGFIIFQLPSCESKEHVGFNPEKPIMEMHGIPKDRLVNLLKLECPEVRIIEIAEDHSADPLPSFSYFLQKNY